MDEGPIELPPEWIEERDALREEIYDTFRNATRNGGVSWSQTIELDMYGTPEAFVEAGRRDRDTSWPQLVDSKSWVLGTGIGGFAFLDPIGFRYYLPAAMARSIRGDEPGFLAYTLRLDNGELREHILHKWSALTDDDKACVLRFLQFMVKFENHRGWEADDWQAALDSYWGAEVYGPIFRNAERKKERIKKRARARARRSNLLSAHQGIETSDDPTP